LAQEVARRGWIVVSAHPREISQGKLIEKKEARGQLDLYLARPDGSQLRNITNTDECNEYGAQFSPDGKRLLYFRLPAGKEVNHDTWGASGELVIARADGTQPVVQGKSGEFPWATWGPDGRQIACLDKKQSRIRMYDVETKKIVKEMPSQGMYQQMFWSPDGKRLCGTGNMAGRQWNIVSLDLESQRLVLLSRGGVGSCTPDWFQNDPQRVIYSHRINGITPRLGKKINDYGFTMLMQATADGKKRGLVYGRLGKHVYFGCTSPDGKYAIFADDPADGLVVGELHIIRMADTPIIAPQPPFPELNELFPNAKEGPVLDLKLPGGTPLRGFEPHWTRAEL
jgi:Tol biopolymer transport system component